MPDRIVYESAEKVGSQFWIHAVKCIDFHLTQLDRYLMSDMDGRPEENVFATLQTKFDEVITRCF